MGVDGYHVGEARGDGGEEDAQEGGFVHFVVGLEEKMWCFDDAATYITYIVTCGLTYG